MRVGDYLAMWPSGHVGEESPGSWCNISAGRDVAWCAAQQEGLKRGGGVVRWKWAEPCLGRESLYLQ